MFNWEKTALHRTFSLRLVDFFRLSVKVDRSMVTLDDEMELLEAYMELMCCRYPDLNCEYDIDPDLAALRCPTLFYSLLWKTACSMD